MGKARRQRQTDPVAMELESIKMLLILFLIKAGAQQSELALALGMDRADVSRMLPARKVKRFEMSVDGNGRQ